MLNKKLMILAIFFVSLLAVSVVSAADNATDDVVGVEETTDDVVGISDNDVNNIVISNENENDFAVEGQNDEFGAIEANGLSKSPGTFTDLTNDIANAGDEFELTKDYVYNNGTDLDYANGIIIDKKIIINGNGHCIDGNNSVRAFYTSFSNVILKNILFKNCFNNECGGAIYWEGVNGSLYNCSFVNNYATNSKEEVHVQGGAIYWKGKNGSLYNCNFEKNFVTNDGGRHSSGGAIYWNGIQGSISNCSFMDCFSKAGSSSCGGAIYWKESNGSLSNCSFSNCYSRASGHYTYFGSSGGAVYWYGVNGILCNCSFSKCYLSCSVYNYINNFGGGAIYWRGSQGLLKNCEFKNCYCSLSASSSQKYFGGGAIYWEGGDGVFIKSKFENCFAKFYSSSGDSMGYYGGGAIFWNGQNGFLSYFTFNNCTTKTSLSSTDWKPYSCGGAIFYNGINGTLSNCNLTNCQASSSSSYSATALSFGGGITWFGPNGFLSNSNFINCSAVSKTEIIKGYGDSYSYGGAIYWYGSNGMMSNSNFINCSAVSIASPKESIAGDAYSYGGAIYWGSNYAVWGYEFNGDIYNGFLNNCSFINCSSLSESLYGGSSESSYSKSYGGSVYWRAINGTVNNSIFINSLAKSSSNPAYLDSYGGSIYWQTNDGFLSNCIFTNSSAITTLSEASTSRTYGGAIHWEGNGGVVFNSTFTNCLLLSSSGSYYSYSCGGAIYWSGINGTVSDCCFKGCSAKKGYSIYWISNVNGSLGYYKLYDYEGIDKNHIYCDDKFIPKIIVKVNNISETDIIYGKLVLTPLILANIDYIDVYVDDIFYSTISKDFNLNLNNLNVGKHIIKLLFKGNEIYSGIEINKTLNILKASSYFNVFNNGSVLQINVSYSDLAMGNITITLDNQTYCENVINSFVSLLLPKLKAGNYTCNLTYSGDLNHFGNSTLIMVSIPFKETKINISSEDIIINQKPKIEYTFINGATGLLSIYLNNNFVMNVTLGNTIELSENLSAENYTVKVIYSGDEYYAPCENSTTFEVHKLKPTFSFTKNNAIAGDEFVITYILNSDATGNITFNNSTKQLTNGKVNFTINNIKGGSHQFKISYSGDNKYDSMNKTINVNIKFKDSIVDFDVKDIIWSDSLTIAPILTTGTTGYLSIYIDNNLNSTININGRKDFTFYVGGYHFIKVTYSGDDFYASNSTTKGFNVIKLNSTCDIKGNIEIDNSATVYVTLNEDATGKVSISIGGTKYTCNLVGAVATFRVPNLPASTYDVFINYEGDSKYNSIHTTKSLEVTLKPSTIALNVRNILSGYNLRITPVVTSSASGSLKIYVDNVLKKTIDIGSSYTIENPSIGKHDIRVVYNGDSYHQGNETKTTFRVFTFYPIEAQNTAIIYGTNKHFQAIFYDEYGNVVGNKLVAFSVDGEDTVVMTDTNGLAVFNKDLPIGTYTVTVINAYVNEEHDYNLKVFTSIESEDMTRAYNTGMDFKVKLLDENGDTLSKGYALFKVNNKDYPVVADNNGIAVLNANLPVGTYTVTTTNGRTGETKTNKITIVPSVNANNMVRGYNSGIDFKAQFLDADAKALINQKVAFIVDNVEYDVTTDANGFAVLNEQLDVGTYEVTAINKVTGEKATRNLTIVDRIVENNDVIRIYGEESYYTIHVVGDDGSFVGENEIINININNIDYQIRTDSNGYASFRIDENIGSYEILAEYKGYEVYNEVYVLQRVNYITNIDVKDISYKQNAIINLNLSTFLNNAFVEFEIIGDNGYYEVFDQLANSYLSLPVSGLNAGKYTVSAKYYDLNTYKFSSMTKTFNVNKINPKIIIVVENANVSETAKITVNIPEVEGDVEIKIGNTLTFNEYLVKNGVIIKEINDFPADDYNVYVTYKGDNNYNVFTQSAILTIIQPKELTTVVSSDITTTQGVGTYLVATLKDIRGNVLVNKGVSIYFNGLNSILTTDKNGQVRLTIGGNLAPNTYVATISFVGDDYYVESSTVAKVIVNKKPVKTTLTLKKVTVKRSAKKLTIQATLKINGKAVKGKTIKFKFNKKSYKAKTNVKGVAKIKIAKKVLKKLKKGKKVTYTASYGKITKKVTVKVK